MTNDPKTLPRFAVYRILDGERDYQVAKGTATNGAEHPHSIEEFLLYMEDYLHEARNVASRVWGPEAGPKTMDIMRKVIALGVACAEQHGMPQRAGFERDLSGGEIRVVMLDVTQDTLYGKLRTMLRLLKSMPDDILGYDHNGERGDRGGAYHLPLVPQIIPNVENAITILAGGKPPMFSKPSSAAQIEKLTTFIQTNVPGEPSKDEGAVDTAIRLLSRVYVGQPSKVEMHVHVPDAGMHDHNKHGNGAP